MGAEIPRGVLVSVPGCRVEWGARVRGRRLLLGRNMEGWQSRNEAVLP